MLAILFLVAAPSMKQVTSDAKAFWKKQYPDETVSKVEGAGASFIDKEGGDKLAVPVSVTVGRKVFSVRVNYDPKTQKLVDIAIGESKVLQPEKPTKKQVKVLIEKALKEQVEGKVQGLTFNDGVFDAQANSVSYRYDGSYTLNKKKCDGLMFALIQEGGKGPWNLDVLSTGDCGE